jgi:HprK-related kinase A
MTLDQLSRPELASSLRGGGVPIRMGPLLVRVGTSLPELVDPISLLYAQFPLGSDDELCDFEARIEPARSWSFGGRSAIGLLDGEEAFDRFPRRQALPMLEWLVNWGMFSRPNQFLLLHAAVIEHHGRALILSGKAGAGKSTLTAGLLCEGWRLLSDELAVVPPGRRVVLPVPRPIGLKNDSIGIIRRRWPDAVMGPACDDTRKGTVAHLRPPHESVRRAAEPAVPSWLVFPRFAAGAPTELRPVSRAQALLRAGGEALNYSLLGETGFEALAEIVDGCRCFDLSFRDLAEGLDEIDRLCASPPVQPGAAVAESACRQT